jgi:hypothetical protein
MQYVARLTLACLAVWGSACGDDHGATGDDAPPDAERIVDAAAPDAPSCVAPEDCDWLEDYLREIVGKLAGELEIADGVTLTARASVAERMITRTFLQEELTRLGYAAELHDYGTGASVLGRLPATTGDGGLIVVGAHFDGVPVGPAAADDATGVALVLAAARYFAHLEPRDHPMVFILFDQEEVGLVGSTLYADQLVADETVVDSVHVFDMISWDGDEDGAAELWSPSPQLEVLYVGAGTSLGIPVAAVDFELSDHQSFLDKGFVTIGVSEEFVGGDHTPHYHQATDSYDKIEFPYLASITRLAFTVMGSQVGP